MCFAFVKWKEFGFAKSWNNHDISQTTNNFTIRFVKLTIKLISLMFSLYPFHMDLNVVCNLPCQTLIISLYI